MSPCPRLCPLHREIPESSYKLIPQSEAHVDLLSPFHHIFCSLSNCKHLRELATDEGPHSGPLRCSCEELSFPFSVQQPSVLSLYSVLLSASCCSYLEVIYESPLSQSFLKLRKSKMTLGTAMREQKITDAHKRHKD